MGENSLLALPPLCIESSAASNAGMHKFPLASPKFLSVPPPARIRTKSTYNCSEENYDTLVVAVSDSIVSAPRCFCLSVSIQFSLQSFSSAFHSLCTPRISLPSALRQPSHAQFCRPPSTDCKYYLRGWQRREPAQKRQSAVRKGASNFWSPPNKIRSSCVCQL